MTPTPTSVGTSPLPRSTPEAVGVDPAGVLAFLDDVDAHGIELHSVMLVRHGRVAAEGWWHPYGPERVHLLYSLSKTFTSAALGFAVAEGLVDLDATVLSYFPELDAEVTDPRSRSVLVRHVAAMASGHAEETHDDAWELSPDDLVRGFLLIPPQHEPGTHFAYNQPCTYALAAILQRRAGVTLTEYLGPRLFAPLGITVGGWQQAPPGQDLGFSGLHLTTEAVARFGRLLLDDGMLDGRRVLPAGWVDLASRVHVATAASGGETPAGASGGDWAQGYGFQLWRSRHGYRGDGAFGQFCVVLPEHDAVLVTTAGTEDMQGILDAAWAHLLPAFGEVPAGGAAGRDGSAAEGGSTADGGRARSAAARALTDRLAALTLPLPVGGAPLTEVAFQAGRAGQGRAERLELRRVAAHWEVEVDVDGQTWVAQAGDGRWAVTEPTDRQHALAVAAAATGTGAVHVDVVLLETPHRLTLVGDGAGTLTTRWHTEPLGPVPLSMQRPLPGVPAPEEPSPDARVAGDAPTGGEAPTAR
ncbi:serine hydrolase domain-containing protein [Cellulomonas sp. NS3]|uniref:serine hydrolase domain-containing protein n=1 Tax=Cellulomonas sp. NS3 TaxID=2973977 RepID=UPI0021626062|nr:serine hydrolase [Cellulomonas sp. NS3]